jgi:hypothetical protein
MAKGWDNDPSLFAGLVEEEVGKKLRIISMALLTEIVQRSPVGNPDLWISPAPKGYTGGSFRASHIVSLGSPDYSEPSAPDRVGTKTIQQGAAVVAQGKPFSVIYIQSNLPYSERLENGHSKQAPTGVYANAFHGVTQAYK